MCVLGQVVDHHQNYVISLRTWQACDKIQRDIILYDFQDRNRLQQPRWRQHLVLVMLINVTLADVLHYNSFHSLPKEAGRQPLIRLRESRMATCNRVVKFGHQSRLGNIKQPLKNRKPSCRVQCGRESESDCNWELNLTKPGSFCTLFLTAGKSTQ